MKPRTLVLAALGIASFSLLTGFAAAGGQGLPFHHTSSHPAKMAKFITWKVNDTLDDLKATDAQRAKVLAVKDRLLGEGMKLHAQHDQVHAEIARQWQSDHVDVQQLRTLADQRLTEARALAYDAIDALAEVHDTLTPEQRAKLMREVEELHGER